jgi:rhodanese-related sulfurtransferase
VSDDGAKAPEAADKILQRAAQRAQAMGLPYAGAVTPAEAWQLHQSGAAAFIDVRTGAEWEFVGRVPNSKLIEWRRSGEQQPNPAFLQQLQSSVEPQKPVMFLCRSGVRSHHAAELATRAGYRTALNILEGFEGDLDGQQHRSTQGGWRFHGLPWIQG